MSENDGLDLEVATALRSALKILIDLATDTGLNFPLHFEPVNRKPLTLKYGLEIMIDSDRSVLSALWILIGKMVSKKQTVHLVLLVLRHMMIIFTFHSGCDFFGCRNSVLIKLQGVADPNEEAYLEKICNIDRLERDYDAGDKPVWFGEWSLATQFKATDIFIRKWADAQKAIYGQGAGWIFWNFKLELSEAEQDLPKQWSVA